MPRLRCLTCDGAEVVFEWRLVWRERRDGALVLVGRKVDSQEQGTEEMAKLGPAALYAEVLSGAKDCPNCKAKPVGEAKPGAEVRSAEERPARDWKKAQAGDDEG